MMEIQTQIQTFNSDFGTIRIVEKNGESYFVGKDICDILEYRNGSRDINRHCDEEDIVIFPIQADDQLRQSLCINESGLYSLILSSNMPKAKEFKRWVTSVVLPSIRKNGMYAKDELLDNPDLLLEVVSKLKKEKDLRLQLEKRMEIMKPKAEFYDTVAGSKDALDFNNAAKLLSIGRNNLFELLRRNNILMKDNVPYQRYVDSGYFRVIEQKYNKPSGETFINIKTLVFQKGIDFIRKIIEKDKGGKKHDNNQDIRIN